MEAGGVESVDKVRPGTYATGGAESSWNRSVRAAASLSVEVGEDPRQRYLQAVDPRSPRSATACAGSLEWLVRPRPEVRAFEKEFAATSAWRTASAWPNGTDAIELALRAVGVTRGDRVLTVANAGGYASLAHPGDRRHTRLRRRGSPDLLISPTEVESAIAGYREDPPPRAVVVTHLYGRVADVVAIREVADRYDVAVVEDCAQAHGAARDGRRRWRAGRRRCVQLLSDEEPRRPRRRRRGGHPRPRGRRTGAGAAAVRLVGEVPGR